MQDKDITNRRASVALAEHLPHELKQQFLRCLINDRAPGLRRDALNALCLLEDGDATDYLKKALLDNAAAVREYARWKLTNLGENIHFRKFYREKVERLTNGHVSVAALAGLGETGRKDDAQLIAPLLQNDDPPSNALTKPLNNASVDALWDAMTTATQFHVKRNALRLLKQTGKWESLIYLLKSTSSDDADVRELALAYVAS